MSEKEKRKNKPTEHETAPFWMYAVFFAILLMTLIFPLFHILRAYPHVYEFQPLSWSTLRWYGGILCVTALIGINLENSSKRKWILGIFTVIVAYATIFHDGVGLLAIGVLLLPITAIVFPIYLVGLFLMRLMTRKLYLWEIVALIGLKLTLGLGIITFSYFSSTRFAIIDKYHLDDKTYHLMLSTPPFDPTFIKLYECNDFDLLCNEIYAPNDYYYDTDKIQWEVNTTESTITIIVNDEPIHTHNLKSASD